MEHESEKATGRGGKWAKRAGIITFLFFLGKGLVWLGVIATGAYYSFY